MVCSVRLRLKQFNLLSLSEVGLQCVAELLGIFDKLSLTNVEYLLYLGRLHRFEQIVDSVQFLFDGRSDFPLIQRDSGHGKVDEQVQALPLRLLDGFEESFAVVYLVRYAA